MAAFFLFLFSEIYTKKGHFRLKIGDFHRFFKSSIT